jgi:hypothetical protein
MIIALTLYKLRGMKIQMFQKYVIFLYLVIFIIQVIQTSIRVFIVENNVYVYGLNILFILKSILQ